MRSNLLAALTLATCVVPGSVLAEEGATTYRVTFERTWSERTHPQDFPLLAHFSPVIGATHGGDYALFSEGASASAGIERLCEEGKHQPLDTEIRSQIESGRVGSLIETMEPIRSVPGSAQTRFSIDADHPMVSIAAMIAPSPDWCAVAAGVSLMEGGRFVAEKTVELYAWDVGTDSATSYRALDADTLPHTPEMRSRSPYFLREGASVPVGRVTFIRE